MVGINNFGKSLKVGFKSNNEVGRLPVKGINMASSVMQIEGADAWRYNIKKPDGSVTKMSLEVPPADRNKLTLVYGDVDPDVTPTDIITFDLRSGKVQSAQYRNPVTGGIEHRNFSGDAESTTVPDSFAQKSTQVLQDMVNMYSTGQPGDLTRKIPMIGGEVFTGKGEQSTGFVPVIAEVNSQEVPVTLARGIADLARINLSKHSLHVSESNAKVPEIQLHNEINKAGGRTNPDLAQAALDNQQALIGDLNFRVTDDGLHSGDKSTIESEALKQAKLLSDFRGRAIKHNK